MNYDENNDNFLKKDIQVIQYPKGNLSYSNGQILDKIDDCDYKFFHSVDTESGSSGSPIVIKWRRKSRRNS